MTVTKRFRRIVSFILSFTLLFQQFAPVIAYADELATPSATLSLSEVTPTPSLPPEIEVPITPSPTPSPSEANPPLAETPFPSSPTPIPIWTTVDENTIITSQSVGEGIDYRFKDSKVSVHFTKVSKPGRLTIRQVTLTPEQVSISGALSEIAYDITSDMENGTFTYDLILPLPENNQDAKVEFATDQNSLDQSTPIENTVTKNPDTIVIKNLDHFTLFFVTGGSDRATDGSLCGSLGGQCAFNASEKTSLKYDDDNKLTISEYSTTPDTTGFWPDTNYASDRYVQFNFTPGLSTGTVIENAYLKIVYQTNAIDSSQPFAAKLQLNNPWADFSVDIGPNLATTDQSYLIPLPATHLTRTKLNNLSIRFFMYGSPQESVDGVTTNFDQVVLLVNYQPPSTVLDTVQSPTNNPTPIITGTASSFGGATLKNVQYRIDSGAWIDATASDGAFDTTSEAFTFTLSSQSEGSHLVEVQATDSLDTIQTDTVSANLTIDTTKPSADLIFPTPGGSATSFQVTFSEDINELEATDSANYFLDNWPGTGGSGDLLGDANVSYDEPTKTATVTFSSLGWYLSAEQNWGVKNITDLAGNQIDDTWEYTTTLVSPDSPGIPTTSPNPTNSIPQLWSWTAATDPGGDEGSGIKGYWFNTSVNPTWSYLGNLLSTSTDFSSEGLFLFSVKAEDNAGNLGGESTGEVTLDLSAPVLTEKTIFSGWYNSDQISTFTYTDNIGVSTGTPVECTITTEGEDQTCTNSSVNVCDEAGNCNTASPVSNGANIDKTLPAIIFSSDVDSGPTTGDDINLVITETYLELSSPQYGFSDDATCDASDSYSTAFVSGETFNISDETNNGKYICAMAADLAGNIGYQISANPLNIDVTPPSANITSPANNSYQKTRPTVNVTASDLNGIASVKFQYRLSGETDFIDLNTDTIPSPYRAVWGSVVLTTNTIYDLRAIVTDSLGNFSLTSIISFTFDNQLPDILYNNPLGGETVWYNASPTFDIDFIYDSAGSPLDYAQYRIDSGTFRNIFTADRTSDYTRNWSIASWSTLSEGLHQIDIRLRDKAGNVNTDNYLSGVSGLMVGKDNISPVVTVPDNQILEATSPDGTQYDFSPVPSALDANSSPLTTCDYDSGSIFPIGTTTVTCSAADLAGNVGSAEFEITVKDSTDPESRISSPSNNGTNSIIYSNSWDGTIAGSATDSASPIDRVELSIRRLSDGKYYDGSGFVAGSESETRVTAAGTDNWSYTLPNPSEDSYEITSHAVDLAGNTENSYELTIVFDKTIPEVDITLNPTNPDSGNNWYKTDPSITLTATDNTVNDHIEYQWNSTVSTWTVYSSSFQTPGEGNHTLYYKAFDKAGNISQIGIKGIKYDKTGLTNGPLNVSVSPNLTNGNTAKVKWDAAADNVGIEKYEVNWSLDGTATSYTESVGNEIRELEIKKLDVEGKWNIKVTAFDYAGNNKSGSTELTVDKTATTIPTLSLSGTGIGTATLTWNLVSDATDYILWYGNSTGQYLYGARTGNSNNFTVSGLGSGDYYFVIQSVDGAGNRSGYSNEVNTLSLVGAPGVEPGTPAEGFTPEVLGDNTSETEVTITPTPTSSVLGNSTDNNFPKWLMILLLSSGCFGLYLLFQRRGNIVN